MYSLVHTVLETITMHNPVARAIATESTEQQIRLFLRRQINRAVKLGGKVAVEYRGRLYSVDRARIKRGRLQVRNVSIMTGLKYWRPFIIGLHGIQFSN